jgi:hypothetical protein
MELISKRYFYGSILALPPPFFVSPSAPLVGAIIADSHGTLTASPVAKLAG